MLDLQLAVYALVARSLAAEWKVPKKVTGTYVYVGRSAVTERDFRQDFDGTLEPKAWQWMAIAAGLLSERVFPRTTTRRLRVLPVQAGLRRRRLRARRGGPRRLDGPLGDFRVLKAGPDPVGKKQKRKSDHAGADEEGAPDQAQRDAAIAERDRNVIVNAGAGTGKTSILVSRFVEMVAPAQSAAPAVSISRIAAITFTRKAAGELRLRIRERLLAELARVKPDSPREVQLRDALAGLDTAYVGTIHSFADRLLRLRPVKALLSPSYEIAEDDEALIRETFQVLLQAVESETLAAELEGDDARQRVRTKPLEPSWMRIAAGLQIGDLGNRILRLVRVWTPSSRVYPPARCAAAVDAPPASIDFGAFRKAADEFIREAAAVTGGSLGRGLDQTNGGDPRRRPEPGRPDRPVPRTRPATAQVAQEYRPAGQRLRQRCRGLARVEAVQQE